MGPACSPPAPRSAFPAAVMVSASSSYHAGHSLSMQLQFDGCEWDWFAMLLFRSNDCLATTLISASYSSSGATSTRQEDNNSQQSIGTSIIEQREQDSIFISFFQEKENTNQHVTFSIAEF